ncbi:MAG: DUF779 domain-containing protein [Myxococcota bacterium]
MGADQVVATDAAVEWLRRLSAEHGDLVLFQSGGCCDGSAPMCWPRGDFKIGARDVLMGTVAGVPFWIGGDQYEQWKHTKLTLDVVVGRGAGFSLEAPEGVRFLIRSDLCSIAEIAALEASPRPRGAG